MRSAVTIFFALVVSAPFVLTLLTRPPWVPPGPLYPDYIELRIARWLLAKDVVMSDVPSAVAWYGRNPCIWLSINNKEEFSNTYTLKSVQALYLTQRTTDHFLSPSAKNESSWESFSLRCCSHGEVPDFFPLTKAPLGFLPDRVFLSDKEGWKRQSN